MTRKKSMLLPGDGREYDGHGFLPEMGGWFKRETSEQCFERKNEKPAFSQKKIGNGMQKSGAYNKKKES